ncbi:MAG: L,D-transpeptidase family protein [Sulfuriferula sp.]|nr:L,D-transpeptidase family protein [Sulfuriferula sp.]
MQLKHAATLLFFTVLSAAAQADEKLAMAASPFDATASARTIAPRSHTESLLAQTLLSIQQNRLDVAIKQVENLIHLHPDFRLAQLIHGDLLLARAQPLTTIGNVNAPATKLNDLRDEARVRLNSYLERPTVGTVPEQLLQLDPSIPAAIVVDTSKSRLYVFKNQNGELSNVADFYVTIGRNGAEKTREGDGRTPLGVYYITRKLEGNKLPDLYGSFAFPLNFPNDWDQKQGNFGHGIWLHGTVSSTYSRPPKASDGCVVLTNNDLDELGKYLTPGVTPVVITGHIKWVAPQSAEADKDALMRQVEAWRHDWESRNTDHFLRHYAANFTANGTKFSDWAAAKRRTNQSKTWINVDLSRISMFEYPGQKRMYMVSFEQTYRSNNLNNVMHKRQYWVQQNGTWKIVAENGA